MPIYPPEIQLWVGTDTSGEYLPCGAATAFLQNQLTPQGQEKFSVLLEEAAPKIHTGYEPDPQMLHGQDHADERPVARLVVLLHLAHEAAATHAPYFRSQTRAGDLYEFPRSPLDEKMPGFFKFVQEHCFDAEANKEFLGKRQWLLDAGGVALSVVNPAVARAAAEARLSAAGWKEMGQRLADARIWREENWKHGNFFKNFRDGYAALAAEIARYPQYTDGRPLIVTKTPLEEARKLSDLHPEILTPAVLRSHVLQVRDTVGAEAVTKQLESFPQHRPDYLDPAQLPAVFARVDAVRLSHDVFFVDYDKGSVERMPVEQALNRAQAKMSPFIQQECSARAKTITTDSLVTAILKEDDIDRMVVQFQVPVFPRTSSLRHIRRLPQSQFEQTAAVNAVCSPVSPTAVQQAPQLSVYRSPSLLSRELAAYPDTPAARRMRQQLDEICVSTFRDLSVLEKDSITLQLQAARLTVSDPERTAAQKRQQALGKRLPPALTPRQTALDVARSLVPLAAYRRGRSLVEVQDAIKNFLYAQGLTAKPEKTVSALAHRLESASKQSAPDLQR